jgi:hypothetical protein
VSQRQDGSAAAITHVDAPPFGRNYQLAAFFVCRQPNFRRRPQGKRDAVAAFVSRGTNFGERTAREAATIDLAS